jgi:hypothetical protein
MGLSISWIGVRGLSREDILQRLEVVDTGRADESDSAELALAELMAGWTVIRSQDFDFPRPKLLAKLSQDAEVVAAQMEEHVMFSAARGFRDGRQVWSLVHDPNHGLSSLVVDGDPPAALAAISSRLQKRQAAEGGEEADVDFILDAAPELVGKLCGYRPDHGEPPVFMQLEFIPRSFVQGLAAMFGLR